MFHSKYNHLSESDVGKLIVILAGLGQTLRGYILRAVKAEPVVQKNIT